MILTFDEDDSSSSNQIFTLFLGPMVAPGLYSNRINHFNVLRTIEDMYGLGYAGAAAAATPITVAWTTSVPGTSTLSAQAGDGQVSLTWTAAGGAQAYNLYRGTSSNGEAQLAPGIAGTSYVDTAVTNGTTYYTRSRGPTRTASALSDEVNAPNPAPVPPAAPSNLTATGGSERVTLNWVNHATTATAIAIERKQNPNQPFTQIATSAPAVNHVCRHQRLEKTMHYGFER